MEATTEVRFRCTCGRSVVTCEGTEAARQRRCTRCRVRMLRRRTSDLVRSD